MPQKGLLRPEYWISCGVCQYDKHLGEATVKAAVTIATEAGWKRNPLRGWVCPKPECVKALVPARFRKSRAMLAAEPKP